MSSNSNWCPEIYRSVFIDRYNSDHIHVAPCCQALYATEPVEQFDFYSSPYLNSLRDQFDQGQRPIECQRCWDAESHGHVSRRQSAIEFYNLPKEDRTVIFEGLDHSATWACNLACIMCGPEYSSTWAREMSMSRPELIKIGRLFQKSNNFLERVNVRTLKKLHFNGGEPLLNNDHVRLLESLSSDGMLKDVFISYNTNGTTYPSARLIELWSQAKLVKIFFSVDAIDSAFEYIRWPAKWTEVNNNILAMKQQLPSNVMFGVNATVGNYNLFEIKQVWEWFLSTIETNKAGDKSDFCWQLADNYSIKDLSATAKQAAIDCLAPVEILQGIVSVLKKTINQQQVDDWIVKLDALDQSRNNSWRQSLVVSQYY